MTARRVVLAVTLDAPEGYSDYDLLDTLRFHLDLSELNAIEADISAVKMLDAKLVTNPWGHTDFAAHSGSDQQEGTQ